MHLNIPNHVSFVA